MRILFAIPLMVLLVYLLWINVKLYHRPQIVATDQGVYNQDVYEQLQHLKKKLDKGAAEEMQNLYPEGYLFLAALYGLSWANTIDELAATAPEFQEGQKELARAVAMMSSEAGYSIFNEGLQPSFGAFYQGWLNYVRSRYLAVVPLSRQDSTIRQAFQAGCEQIADAYRSHHTPFLFSYAAGSWPADNILCLASLAAHDRLFPDQYTGLRADWLQQIKEKVERHGLIPHEVDLMYGNALGVARGSSQSLMLTFLPTVDSTFAQEQYDIYRDLLVDERLGLPGIREYPPGVSGWGDIDSGPVIWEIGGAASVVGLGTSAVYGDSVLHHGLNGAIEGFGVGWSLGDRKSYLFGSLPVADAFIAWSYSQRPLNVKWPGPIYWKFHFISLGLFFLFGALCWLVWRKRKGSPPKMDHYANN